MESVYQTILLEVKDGIAVVVFNRPDKFNTITPKLEQELDQALDELERRDRVTKPLGGIPK